MALGAFAEGLARVEVLRAFHIIICDWELCENLSHRFIKVWHHHCTDLYSQRLLENRNRQIVLLVGKGEENLAYHTDGLHCQ